MARVAEILYPGRGVALQCAIQILSSKEEGSEILLRFTPALSGHTREWGS